jgi:serine/threonine protein kinase
LEVGELPLFHQVVCPHCRREIHVRRRWGRFDLLDVLGHGGCGGVFLARDGDSREIALKILEHGTPSYEEKLLFLRNEAATSVLVDHPRIVKTLFLEEGGEGACLGMEWMKGGTLHDLISSRGRLDEETALRIAMQSHKGLAAAHQCGVIHRDIKPANILLCEKGGAKIGDFGLALSTRSKPVAQQDLMATPDYVAPEILGGFRGDELSDIYSLGGCLYHAILGHPPHETEGLSVPELRAAKEIPPSLESVSCSRKTQQLLRRLLDPVPERRVRSDAELDALFLGILGRITSRET